MDLSKLLPYVFRVLHLRPRIEQTIKEADPVLQAFKQQAPTFVPALKSLIREAERTYQEAKPVIEAYRKQAPTLQPLVVALLNDLAPEIVKEFNKQQDTVISVSWVQRTLNALGASPKLIVDNEMGPATHAATKQFQAAYNQTALPEHKLVVDGWVGPATLTAMYLELEKRGG